MTVPWARRRTLPATCTQNSLRMRSAAAKTSAAVGIADDLHQPFAVAQVDEDHPAVVAAAMHPAEQGDHLVEMSGATLAA